MTPSEFQKTLNSLPSVLAEAVSALAKRVPKTSSDGVVGHAFLVGGMVRDLLTDVPVTDADVEVYGIAADDLRALLEELFPGRVHDVGSSFNVYKVALEDGLEMDVSLPRRESKTGKGHKGFDVVGDPTMTIEEAARRRDFTINAMMADPLTGEVMDPYHGRDDLKNRVLRVVDPATFVEDPLRVYRALQFAARFDLKVDGGTMELLKTMVSRGDLDELPKERVTAEIRKLLLKAEKPSIGLTLARDLGIIERDYPELWALTSTPQEKEWHPEGDVWIHTLMVTDMAATLVRQPERELDPNEWIKTILGALCHDLGKPATTKELDGRIRSLEHESGGEAPTRVLLSRWSFGADVDHAALMVAQDHLKPGMLLRELEKGNMNEDQYINAVRRVLKRIYPLDWKTYLTSCEADYRGRALPTVQLGQPYTAGDRFTDAVLMYHLDDAPTKPLLRGEDLLTLGIQPGKDMGRIIREVEDARDRGEVKTQEEALALAGRLK